jgi:hypothetical protein
MNAQQMITRLISAEVTLTQRNAKDGARVLRNERMRLQTAVQTRATSIREQMDEAARVADMWGVGLR